MPKRTHTSWCKVLDKCDIMGRALLATAVNCTTRNTLHTDWEDLDLGDSEMEALTGSLEGLDFAGLGGGLSGPPTPTERMCKQPMCMSAVGHLYDAALTTPDWNEAMEYAGLMLPFGGIGIRRRLEEFDFGNMNFDKMNLLSPKNLDAAVKMASKLENAAEIQLKQCMTDAGVDETTLGLPLSIDKMTGGGKFFDMQTLEEKECYTMIEWFETRYGYYSGMHYAKTKMHEGTNVGLIIAIVIGSLNLVCCVGCFGGLVICIRKRACYFCMKEFAPSCVECLVECGCGPEDAERLNNEVVIKAGENGSEGIEMDSQRTA